MDRQQMIYDFHEVILSIYKEEGLNCLTGINQDYTVNGKKILTWHYNVSKKAKDRNNLKFDYDKNLADLLFCSDELMYFTAHLYLYRPFINDPIKQAFPAYNKIVYPNYQNLEGKRYNMFADITCQKAYNYWDRIGDLVASFYQDKIKPNQVYFSTALDVVPEKDRQNSHFQWLLSLKKKEYSELNQIRKQIVHYETINTNLNDQHSKAYSNEQVIQNIQKYRIGLADFYKKHIALTITGFDETLSFLDEVF